MSVTRRVRSPIILVAAVLLIALATLGVGYGLWSKTLTIKGTVNTGEIDARWVEVNCAEFYPWPEGGNPGEVEGKDVGYTEAWIDPDNNQILHIIVTNAYPSYAVDCQVHFWIDGTIPVILRGTKIVAISDNLTGCVLTGNQVKILSCDQMTIEFWDGIGTQIDPPDGGANSLRLHVEQLADQDTEYRFDVGVCFAQWNESANAEQCFAAAPLP
jgi:hypothetical protein